MSKFTTTDTVHNHSDNQPFSSVLEKNLSRRTVMRGGLGTAIALLSGLTLSGCNSDDDDDDNNAVSEETLESIKLAFESIAGSKTDGCAVAAGYTASVLAPWGTPLNSSAAAWKNDGTNTFTDQLNSMGMHHDGMHFFPINGSADDGLLVVNHEYIDQDALHPAGATTDGSGNRPVDEVRKEIYAHGVAVVRIQRTNGNWSVVDSDPLNRRFTSDSVMDIAGPMAGTDHLVTPFSLNGTQTRGTNNNCGNGYTPWGTYLTCEENWPGYFVSTAALTEEQSRIGLSTSGTRYGWDTAAGDATEVDGEFTRWDVTPTGADATQDYRNEASTFGYIVEIDPFDASTRAVKRTALGRFRHEGCWPGKLEEGKPVVFYSGDDSRFEYIYKFVSNALWDPADANPSDRLATGAKYMDEGTLYVARFDEDGTGVWMPLTTNSVAQDGRTLGSIFGDLPSIILNTRGAADALGATPMDRPEWCAVSPLNGDVYFTLTNNTRRTEANAANPRIDNEYGHIIRWTEADDMSGFEWDIFVFGSNDSADADTNLSGLTDLNEFASPDGLGFDSRGILWIETDNGSDVADDTNDQVLAVVPSNVVDADGNQTVITAENQEMLKRFFVGPNGCEVTGLAFNADNTAMFVNIQHPGNWPYSDDATEVTPDGTTVRPRASTVVIQKADGGPIGV
ncbi:PhoX family protein [Marinobacterium lutimaris]|uniref:dTDP-glucose 4,6-dehydratase n=1 Tax=Marinobacterium lutimaris TaxID=568106 RepID=A0A1H6DHD6_9GAMM|nr:PhoX family phosphatase [Marinobacterium lutimaris]SEG84095.1 hypothetical protein SAMN05444390_10680 [Marinobacterium lutimaris]